MNEKNRAKSDRMKRRDKAELVKEGLIGENPADLVNEYATENFLNVESVAENVNYVTEKDNYFEDNDAEPNDIYEDDVISASEENNSMSDEFSSNEASDDECSLSSDGKLIIKEAEEEENRTQVHFDLKSNRKFSHEKKRYQDSNDDRKLQSIYHRFYLSPQAKKGYQALNLHSNTQIEENKKPEEVNRKSRGFGK